MTGTLEVYGTQ